MLATPSTVHCMGNLQQLMDALSRDDRLRGQQFEMVCAWLLERAPLYRPMIKRVWRWNDWPGRWGSDSGIDLVAETVTGELWAVQAKAFAPDYYLKKSDIDSFLSESARPCFVFRLLLATTDLMGSRARSAIAGQSIPVSCLLRSDLESLSVEWPGRPEDLARSADRPRVEPRPAAQRALADIESGLTHRDRGQIVMACGTGKTLVGLWTAERLEASSVLVLVPSLSLLSQTIREWTANWSEPRSFAAVCSDPTVADAGIVGPDELGVPVTTDSAALAAFLSSRWPQVTFATYQSAAVVADACASSGSSFDLLIADEAHRCAGPAAGTFGLATDAARLPATRRLFMTATPRIYTRQVRKEAEDDQFELLSMDDDKRFGPVVHRLSFGAALREGLLTDYEVVITGLGDTAVSEAVGSRRLVEPEGMSAAPILDARTLASLAAVVRATEKYQLRRTVTFHSRVLAAKRFSEQLPRVEGWLGSPPRLRASYVSGAMSSGQRRVRLAELEDADASRPRVLANARCLTEGVNVPNLDAVAFIDPRESQIDIVQAVGRVMRKAPDKAVGRVVLPVFVPAADNEEEARVDLTSSEFATVWRVIRALRAHDETLAEELDQIRREIGRWGRGAARLPSRLVLDLPARFTPDMLETLSLRVVEATAESWPFMFGLLERFVAREGHARPPAAHVEDGNKLGDWVVRQRSRRSAMADDRREALEAIDGWSWDPVEDRWQEGFTLLREYVAREGHAKVPTAQLERGEALGTWVARQRVRRVLGRMDPRHEAELVALPGWAWNAVDERWERGLQALLKYVAANGHTRIPQGHVDIDGFGVGDWVNKQRKAFKNELLSQVATETLAALPGWQWSPRQEVLLEKKAAFTAFYDREGHVDVPTDHDERGVRLGYWVGRCRRQYLHGLLPVEVIQFLEGFRGWSWTSERQRATRAAAPNAGWRTRHALLEAYVARTGDAAIPQKHVEDDVALGLWVSSQRWRYRAGSLHPEAVAQLESIPGWSWAPLEDAWNARYMALVAFAAEHGHCDPPKSWGGGSLRMWVLTQRKMHRQQRLRAEFAERLEQLPGWSWDYLRNRKSKLVAGRRAGPDMS
jgi:superfamily II DNA or RNA helicase